MRAAWVAGGVRARALLGRRIGADGIRALAGAPSLDRALSQLMGGPYGRDLRPGLPLSRVEHAVGACLLWQLRVLAGWQPRAGVRIVRTLAGWFVLANIVDHARRLADAAVPRPYRLGALDTGWSRLSATTTPAQLRAMLGASPWGDPGGTSPATIALACELGWATRVATEVPDAAEWAIGAAALVAARAWFAEEVRPPARAAERAARLLGADPSAGGSLAEFAGALRQSARWALSDVDTPDQLWRAEARWWARLASDGLAMTRGTTFTGAHLTGCVALLAVDAWRVRAALQVVATPGVDALAVFDALV